MTGLIKVRYINKVLKEFFKKMVEFETFILVIQKYEGGTVRWMITKIKIGETIHGN